jgi:hypothetical protein
MVEIAKLFIGFPELRCKEREPIFEHSENCCHRRLKPEELFGLEDLPQAFLISPSRESEAIWVSDDRKMCGR